MRNICISVGHSSFVIELRERKVNWNQFVIVYNRGQALQQYNGLDYYLKRKLLCYHSVIMYYTHEVMSGSQDSGSKLDNLLLCCTRDAAVSAFGRG